MIASSEEMQVPAKANHTRSVMEAYFQTLYLKQVNEMVENETTNVNV